MSRTYRLFSMPSASSGVARLFDISGSFDKYNVDTSEWVADLKALSADWAMVGNDLATSMLQFKVSVPSVYTAEFDEMRKQLTMHIVDADAGTQLQLSDHAA